MIFLTWRGWVWDRRLRALHLFVPGMDTCSTHTVISRELSQLSSTPSYTRLKWPMNTLVISAPLTYDITCTWWPSLHHNRSKYSSPPRMACTRMCGCGCVSQCYRMHFIYYIRSRYVYVTASAYSGLYVLAWYVKYAVIHLQRTAVVD